MHPSPKLWPSRKRCESRLGTTTQPRLQSRPRSRLAISLQNDSGAGIFWWFIFNLGSILTGHCKARGTRKSSYNNKSMFHGRDLPTVTSKITNFASFRVDTPNQVSWAFYIVAFKISLSDMLYSPYHNCDLGITKWYSFHNDNTRCCCRGIHGFIFVACECRIDTAKKLAQYGIQRTITTM